MTNWKKVLMRAGAFAMAAVITAAAPMTANAADEYLRGASTKVNDIKTKNPTSLTTTIETSFHADGVTGFVVLTPADTIDTLLGITAEQKAQGDKAVIYMANTIIGEKAAEVYKNATSKINAEIRWLYDIQMFKSVQGQLNGYNQLSSPLKMVIGLGEGDRSDKYDYAMMRIHDGAVTFLQDMDDEEYTVTFESDKFSTYALVRYPKGTDVSVLTGAAPQEAQTQAPAATTKPSIPDDELDSVPKTGDPAAWYGIAFVLAGASLTAVGMVCRQRIKR